MAIRSEQVQNIMRAQAEREERLRQADDVIVNDGYAGSTARAGGPANTEEYLQLCHRRRA